MLHYNLVLKSDELFLAGDLPVAEIDHRTDGLYLRDTRHLSRFDIALGGAPLDTLSVRVAGAAEATVTAGNEALETGTGQVRPMTLGVEQRVTLGEDLRVRIRIQNYSGQAVSVPLALTWAADFRDLFDIRGFPRRVRGTLRTPAATDDGVVLGYQGLDGKEVTTRISFDRAASLDLTPPMPATWNEHSVFLPGLDAVAERPGLDLPGTATATFAVDVAPGDRWETVVTVAPRPAIPVAVSARATLRSGRAPAPATVSTDHPLFNRFLTRSQADLLMLQTSFADGSLPAAGIPWFVAPFGRDSLIVGLQTVHMEPSRAADTLRVLAARQGTVDDPWRAEEPGKILHEVRYGEMARLGEIPHTPYYGTADATPLWVMLFAEAIAWTGDEALYRELLPHAERAIGWIEGPGDPDGDGLVEYVARQPDGTHIVHQVWKDSHDSLHHTDGSPVVGSVAAVEVQGYVYAAYRRLAEVAELAGETAWAGELRAKAERVRAVVEERFWLEDEGFYAQALDAEKRPVRAISSNPGHLLFCGLPSAERAARMAARFAAPDLDSGWGIRTLSANMPTYNPMSYHNGSIWPHDNSLIAAGLARYGHRGAANHIASALYDVSTSDPLGRLPELFCGFPRDEGSGAPVAYPVSCSPQAWAAASGPLLFAAMLGLRLNVPSGRLFVDPALPPWLDEATLLGLEVRGEAASLTVRRSGTGYDVAASGPVERRET